MSGDTPVTNGSEVKPVVEKPQPCDCAGIIERQGPKIPSYTARNRRKVYLDIHPEYFASDLLELAEPLLYDRLIRKFQTAAERESDGRRKGYSGILEADLMRSEAKLHALASSKESRDQEEESPPENKEEAYQRWRKHMELRFLQGEDTDFDYSTVDSNEDLDHQSDERRRDLEEQYFDDEEPRWASPVDDNEIHERESETGNHKRAPLLVGQTGIQDY